MKRLGDSETAPFQDLLEAYHRCFLEKDLQALCALYASDGELVYFDNHAACDSVALQDHLRNVGTFFLQGKTTESGEVEPLLMADLAVFADASAAVMTLIMRYSSAPRPGVRSTFVLQREDSAWRIRHVHFSFDPNE